MKPSKKKIVTERVRFAVVPATEVDPCSYQGKSYPDHKVPLNADSNDLCVRCGREIGDIEIPDPNADLLAGYVRITAGDHKGRVGYFDDDDIHDGEWVGFVYFGTLEDGYYVIPKRHLLPVEPPTKRIAAEEAYTRFDARTPAEIIEALNSRKG